MTLTTTAAGERYQATITIPGYTRPARRGRAQSAGWWPVGGDSVVVQFEQGAQSRGDMQLRGKLNGNSLAGDVWYVATESGNVFQLGTFTATRTTAPRTR